MTRKFTPALSLLVFVACNNSASATPALEVTKSVTINAPAPEVWDEVNDFDDLDDWHPAVAEAEIIKGGDDNQPGAQRLLTLGDGGTIKEELLAYDEAGMSFTYNILEGVLPVKNYESTLSVESAGGSKSKVTWTGAFDAKGADDKTATNTISSVYQAGLDNLKRQVETDD
jgi:mxaD protein